MLGVESEISIEAEVSRLSVSSNTSRIAKDKNISLGSPSTFITEGAILSANSTNNKRSQKIKELRNKMHDVAKRQEGMETRMKAYLVMFEKELKKKEEQNHELQTFIASLKKQISDSKNDLELLTNYLLKKVSSTPREEQKSPVHTNNASLKQGESSRRMEQNEVKQKNPSPKHTVIVPQKSKNPSPVPRQQKKAPLGLGKLSPMHRKLKSPGK